MSEWIATVVLAVVQGITEFLPISSDGHLAVAGALLKAWGFAVPHDAFHLTVALHIGTLLAVLVFFSRQIVDLLVSHRRVLPLIVLGTVPAVCFGLLLHKYAKPLLDDPLLAGALLFANGFVLLYGCRWSEGEQKYVGMSWLQALWIGCCQAVAILPGISRSGTTIVGGMRCGLGRPDAAVFSFLLSIPAILGAVTLEFKDEAIHLWQGKPLSTSVDPALLLLGIIVSYVVGWLTLGWLLKLVERAKFHYFAYWCFAMGAVVVAWQLASPKPALADRPRPAEGVETAADVALEIHSHASTASN